MLYEDAEELVSTLNQELGLNPEQGFQVPSTLDVMLACFLSMSCPREKKKRILPQGNSVSYTWCKERGEDWEIIAGGVSHSGGLCVKTPQYYYLQLCGVCPVRKFSGQSCEINGP